MLQRIEMHETTIFYAARSNGHSIRLRGISHTIGMKSYETVANSGDDATVAGDLQSRIIIFIGQAIAIVEMPEDATAAIDAGKSFVGGKPGIAFFIAGNGMNG